MGKIKVGIVGLGMIGAAHIEALRRLGGVEVVAVADRDALLAQSTADKWDIPRAYTDYEALIADGDVQSVHICTPNHLHYPIAKAALLAGKHVVCEKPLVLELAQAEELCALAEERELVAAVVFNLRYYPMVQQARLLHKKGEAGRLLAFHGSYLQDWLLLDTDYSWRIEPEIGGACRAVGDIGSHWLDMAEHVTGQRIQSLCADMATFHPVRKKPRGTVKTFAKADAGNDYEEVEIMTEDYAAVLFQFENGARGSVVISQAAAGRKNSLRFELDGDRAALAWDSEEPEKLWMGRRESPSALLVKDPALLEEEAAGFTSLPGGHVEGFADAQKQLFARIYGHMAGGGHSGLKEMPYPTFRDGLRKVALCEAVLKSSCNRRWESV